MRPRDVSVRRFNGRCLEAREPSSVALDREGKVMRPRLRLFTGKDTVDTVAEPDVNIRLGEITNILADAVRSDRTWLSDFENDDVKISSDLYEVLSSYWHLRPSA